ncbi:MAG: PorT family protein [Fibromonadaceae bacterium]|jgi:hypothetical protein|nr:PorT family protein [Fibromonadaceae bacterium]
MNKILIIALLTLTAGFSFSQESTFKLGARAGFNLYNVFWNGKPPGMGMGYGGGITGVFPITGSLAFNPEVNFYRRNVYNHELSGDEKIEIPAGPMMGTKVGGTIKENMTEFAVGVPLLLQFTPISDVPFYVIGGVLFTIPISTKLECDMSLNPPWSAMDRSETMDFKNRSKVDVGIVLGTGYYITKNFAVDIRGSVDLTDISSEKNYRNPPYNPFRHDKTWLIQYGLGINYLLN